MKHRSGLLAWLFILSLAGCGGGGGSSGAVPPPPSAPPPPPVGGVGPADCVGGMADGFACSGLNLHARVTLAEMGGVEGNDLWGWTDVANDRRYGLMGMTDRVGFVDVTDPEAPIVLGSLPTATSSSSWRDIKVANNTAYVVADNVGNHGMQVFDLTRLRGATGMQTFSADLTYGDFGSAHNIVINEDSNYAYVVGSNTCGGGLHMIDISTPLNPMFAGCYSDAGDTHDAQCVNYIGPDADYAGQEICFASNEERVAITDVSTKSSPVTVAVFTYPELGFVHQNWLTEDHRYLIIGDELDERDRGGRTRTIVFDVSDLDSPVYLYTHLGVASTIDHNLYVLGNRLFQANYTSGLRILSFADLASDTFIEDGFFDTHPESDSVSFTGAWSVYPYFSDGTILVSDTERGLFVLSE